MVYVPGISKTLSRRKGGGKGRGGKFGSSGSSSGKSIQKNTKGLPLGKTSTTTYGSGGGPVSTIRSGIFTGRTVGGGTRANIFGNRKYGSGYPGYPIGVVGYGFPFFFWPLAFGETYYYGAHYIHSDEYGSPDNSSRPGGPMVTSTYASSTQNTTFYLVTDTDTADAMVSILQQNCSSVLNPAVSNAPVPYDASDPNSPKPEETVQYYRSSSAALMLEGYNNTGQLSDDTSLPDTPLPTDIDTDLLTCLNETIGAALPLVDAANPTTWNFGVTGSAYTISSFWLLYYALSVIF
ncbi:hypothetical protein BDM02DRAFT_2574042 [Thelephora ganbajun]|uniref:Uncharacterized protein n=1 Tax=Thelephora ganbajun TaxID=370292 RepID=A0ACB6ZT63_THEGA|nr:hypothetical protein BDM02DRAFT_2574042 [Thelephora ganbajun]